MYNQKELNDRTLQLTLASYDPKTHAPGTIKCIEIILETNVNKGGSYQQIADYVLNYLKPHIKITSKTQVDIENLTIDVINRFSACYNIVFTEDLGLEWYMYNGSLLETSRVFCKACVKKKYIHVSEFAPIIKGDFLEYKQLKGKVDKDTGLCRSIHPETTNDNFLILRGGTKCGHQLDAVSDVAVPKDVQAKLLLSENYRKWLIKKAVFKILNK